MVQNLNMKPPMIVSQMLLTMSWQLTHSDDVPRINPIAIHDDANQAVLSGSDSAGQACEQQ